MKDERFIVGRINFGQSGGPPVHKQLDKVVFLQARPGTKGRDEIIAEVRRQRAEIAQYFTDVEHWNTHCRKPHEAVIDPDPDGQMKKIAEALDKCLANEERIAAALSGGQ
jgi:hypothetical protein